jgi:hypothetical protein
MRKTALLFSIVIAAMSSCNDAGQKETAATVTTDSTTVAATKPTTPEPTPVLDSATKMKNMMEAMTPGEMHKMLASFNGKWTGDVTMWMDPAAPPSKSVATVENKMILGGRYQQSTHKGDMGGMPFEGVGTFGYDNAKKMFVSSWTDNMGTGIMHLEGPYDEATKTITLKGKCMNPENMKEMEIRETLKIVDDKNQVMEMYMTNDGKETKSMEIKLVRK